MDWDYFRADDGGFKLKRLPPLKAPIKVKDETDLSDWRGDFRGLSFDRGLREYRDLFGAFMYEIDYEDVADAFNRLSAKDLGELGVFAKHYGVVCDFYLDASSGEDEFITDLGRLTEEKLLKSGFARKCYPENVEEWGDALMQYKMPELKQIAASAGIETKGVLKGALCQTLASAGHAGNSHVPKPAYPGVRAEKLVIAALDNWHREFVESLSQALDEYPPEYKARVMEDVCSDMDDEVVPSSITGRYIS
ncbi:hypothetical protein F0A16_20670 [Salinicola corii]|uniref:Uncharacterized protein n=1 Tax=Salinicola corii TaxID=2606937 RepID=A0A640WAC2_9GAMM|nr:hypothetical protein [Salinicola corii]KAA0015503.1 hypothetical protein F0A16_20670 [Salinicola corii]